MIIRVLVFLTFIFALVMYLLYNIKLPIDGLLLALGLLMLAIVALFAHYRYVGKLRTSGQYHAALRQLKFWWMLLPSEAYKQLRIQILIESSDFNAARKSIEDAEAKGMETAFSGGFRADIERRQGNYKIAEQHLQRAIDATPPGLLRTGLLTQLARLYIHNIPTKANLKQVGFLLDEAESLTKQPPHSDLIKAVRGEWYLVKQTPKKAIEALQPSLDALFLSAVTYKPSGFFNKITYFLAQVTYSQRDEHQYPFFAELCLSLGRAYAKRRDFAQARTILQQGLSLTQQSFVAEPLQKELDALPSE